MNIIFNVIWNRSLGGAIIAVENTKSVGRTVTKIVKNLKNTSNEKEYKATIKKSCNFIVKASILTTLMTNTAIAAYATGDNSISFGALKPISGTVDEAWRDFFIGNHC